MNSHFFPKPSRISLFWSLLLSFLMLAGAATESFALNAKIRMLFPLSSSASVDGFGDSVPKSSEMGVTLILPVSQSTRVGVGYTYFGAAVEDSSSSGSSILKHSGSFNAHLLEVGADYTGFQLTSRSNVLLNFSVKLPVSGTGSIQTTGIPASETGTQTVSSVNGTGIFLGAGASYGRWEALLYYQRSDFSYDLQIQRAGESAINAALHLTEVGIGVGYIF